MVPKIRSRTDKHTNTQTDSLITILRSPIGGGVVNTLTSPVFGHMYVVYDEQTRRPPARLFYSPTKNDTESNPNRKTFHSRNNYFLQSHFSVRSQDTSHIYIVSLRIQPRRSMATMLIIYTDVIINKQMAYI